MAKQKNKEENKAENSKNEGSGKFVKFLTEFVSYFVVFVIAFVAASVGTVIHRTGVNSFPIGLITAIILTISGVWLVRARYGKNKSVFFTAIFVVFVAFYSTVPINADVLVPVYAFKGASQLSYYVGYIWIFASSLLCATCTFMPDSFFTKEKRIKKGKIKAGKSRDDKTQAHNDNTKPGA